MTTLSMEQVADLAYGAGLRGDDIATAVAIAKAESNLLVTARGDVGIQTSKWGPSIGLWQVRSLKAERGTGRARDELALYSPSHNARAMYEISSGGSKWTPWSVYTNGKYRTHLPAAKQAADQRSAAGGTSATSGGGAATATGPGATVTVVDENLGTSSDVIIPARDFPINAVAPSRVESVVVEGGRGTARQVADKIIGGRVELTSGEASEVSLDLVNDGLRLFGGSSSLASPISTGYALDWGTIRHRITVAELDDRDGVPIVKVAARSAAVYWLKQSTGRNIGAKRMSPTEWLQTEITRRFLEWPHAGALRFMGQGSARRSDIAPAEQGDGTTENAWQLATRLAKELGYWLFEAGGTVYFGQPSWLIRNATEVKVSLRPGLLADTRLDTLEPPNLRKSEDTDEGATLTVVLPAGRGQQVRPGMRLATAGVYGVTDKWLVTRVSWSLAGGPAGIVTVEAVEPKDPKPQPPAGTGTGGTGDSTPATPATPTGGGTPVAQAGTASALDFVDLCLKQTGDTYVFGAEAAASNANPSAFDCSELVEWAAARIGVKIADGAYNQWKACRRITLAEAGRTRGALLFAGDGTGSGRDAIYHVAISLGDSTRTIEARGRAYGVGSWTIASRFQFAGLIPGMRYG